MLDLEMLPRHKRRRARQNAIAALETEIRWLTDGIEMMREQRRRSVARLLEIAGLDDDIGEACAEMGRIKSAAADVNHHGSRLRAELVDLAGQMEDHRASLSRAAGARPNGSSTLQEQSAKLRAAAAGLASEPDKQPADIVKEIAAADKPADETVKAPSPLSGTGQAVGAPVVQNPF